MDFQFSIIIPHKNSSKLLMRLLDSIPNDYRIQIIVVDDNSNKEEKIILKKFEEQYKFELYDNEGKFAGGARNTGLKQAKGKWLIFADADDYFEPQFKSVLNKYNNESSEIIFFKVISRYSESGEIAYRGNHVNNLHDRYNATGDENYLRCQHLAPWSKMIKHDLVVREKIKFEECLAGNDNWFSANSGVLARNIIVDDTPIYCITVSSGSLTTTLRKDNFEAKFQSSLRTNRFLRKQGKNKYQISILYFIGASYQFGIRYVAHVIFTCFKMGANPFVGISKIFHIRKAIKTRQNKNFVKDERR